MKMLWCRLLPFILGAFIISCEGCNSFELIKWKGNNPVYHQIEAPGTASKALFTCSRWCMEKSSCTLLSWSPGSCWQVGLCGSLNVTGAVYDLKKHFVVGRYLSLSLSHVHLGVKWETNHEILTYGTLSAINMQYTHFIRNWEGHRQGSNKQLFNAEKPHLHDFSQTRL